MKILLSLFLLLNAFNTVAQISCDSFCIENISIDTSANPNILKYTINFRGNSQQFINYPYISVLTDSNSDTLGNGTLNLFGHIGGTAEVYELNTNLDSIPTDFLLHFNFDTRICLFNNFCNPTATFTVFSEQEFIKLYFNKNNQTISSNQDLRFTDAKIHIYDLNGRIIKIDSVQERLDHYPTSDLSPGFYIFQIFCNDQTYRLYFFNS